MGRCEMLIGTIVSHPCGHRARAICGTCQREMCREHMLPPGDICLQCAKTYKPPAAPARVTMQEMFAFSDQEASLFDSPGAGTGELFDS